MLCPYPHAVQTISVVSSLSQSTEMNNIDDRFFENMNVPLGCVYHFWLVEPEGGYDKKKYIAICHVLRQVKLIAYQQPSNDESIWVFVSDVMNGTIDC